MDAGSVADWFSGLVTFGALAYSVWVSRRADARVRQAENRERASKSESDAMAVAADTIAALRLEVATQADTIDMFKRGDVGQAELDNDRYQAALEANGIRLPTLEDIFGAEVAAAIQNPTRDGERPQN